MLNRGVTKSCGCLAREVARQGLLPGQAACNWLLLRCRKNAEVRHLVFDLTKTEVEILFKQDCHYCGVPPAMVIHRPTGDYIYNGLDRVDNTIGYTAANVVACCWPCNRAKAGHSAEDFLTWVSHLHDPIWSPEQVVPPTPKERERYCRYRSSAKERHIAFNLTLDQALSLFHARCAYCGDKTSGIDRLDNTKGYELTNVVPACTTCNYAKGKFEVKSFLAWAERVRNHQKVSISTK